LEKKLIDSDFVTLIKDFIFSFCALSISNALRTHVLLPIRADLKTVCRQQLCHTFVFLTLHEEFSFVENGLPAFSVYN
jgi:hypothetical protein